MEERKKKFSRVIRPRLGRSKSALTLPTYLYWKKKKREWVRRRVASRSFFAARGTGSRFTPYSTRRRPSQPPFYYIPHIICHHHILRTSYTLYTPLPSPLKPARRPLHLPTLLIHSCLIICRRSVQRRRSIDRRLLPGRECNR